MAGQKQGARGQGPRGSGAARTTGAQAARNSGRSSSSSARGRAAAAGRAATAGSSATAKSAPAGKPAANGAQASAAAPASTGPLGRFRGMPAFQWGRLQWAVLLLTLYGLGASIYLTIAHFDTQVSLSCPDTGAINCEKVTTSSYSELFGHIPVAVLGLAFYVFLTGINLPWAWRLQRRMPVIRQARLGSLIVGMVFVLYLIYAETQIGAICIWCTTVHVATFLLFSLVVFDAAFNWGTTDRAR
jgi:uncharacterized membrane protein